MTPVDEMTQTSPAWELEAPRPPLILASGSPRRKELLASLGLDFDVALPTVDERDLPVMDLSPVEQAKALARFKGESIAAEKPDALVISADTVVILNGQLYGKPQDAKDATRMLSNLQGTVHQVVSAVAVFYQGQSVCDALETHVWMRPLTPAEIEAYVQTGEPLDKAGAYAIQGHGSLLIERIEGCYFNVVGMSLYLLAQLCGQLGRVIS